MRRTEQAHKRFARTRAPRGVDRAAAAAERWLARLGLRAWRGDGGPD